MVYRAPMQCDIHHMLTYSMWPWEKSSFCFGQLVELRGFCAHTVILWLSRDPPSVPQPCSGNSSRERSAFPLRQSGEGKECPSTQETQVCKLNSNCFHYSYNITGEYHIMQLSSTWELTTSSHTQAGLHCNACNAGGAFVSEFFCWWKLSVQIGVPVSSARERCAEMASKPACWTVCGATANL